MDTCKHSAPAAELHMEEEVAIEIFWICQGDYTPIW